VSLVVVDLRKLEAPPSSVRSLPFYFPMSPVSLVRLTSFFPTNCASSAAAGSVAAAMFSYVDPTLSWTDLAWVRRASGGLPIIVKGIQSAEDAALAAHYGAAAIVLSNHGSRQLEGAPSSIETLLEIRKFEPGVFDKVEVWCDGGYRRGTDVLKAIALGAKCVGFGRPCKKGSRTMSGSLFSHR
jgi:isopentenyl diphosphate isomerase/L-lactate dehydrogenase-like FMN-dependent dehydrogenase